MKREELLEDFYNKKLRYCMSWPSYREMAEEYLAEHPLPPAEGAKKVQWSGYGELGNISQKPLQPTAEGAEEILRSHPYLKIWIENVGDSEMKVCDIEQALWAMQKFATLHAQQMAEKMVEEKCKKCKYRGLPDSIQEALNSGDGVYRP